MSDRPVVWLTGEVDHPEFAESLGMLHANADVGPGPPELILLVQCRPGVISTSEIAQLRRTAPLAGIATLLGSWCEGETRTGRPAGDVTRLYWYEFPCWWRRQLAIRAAGWCPDWVRTAAADSTWTFTAGPASSGTRAPQAGVVLLNTFRFDTANTLRDVLDVAGLRSVWFRPDRNDMLLQSAIGGIWEGGQLDDREAEQLAAFCGMLKPRGAPVIALLDFPRRDRCELARQAGAAAVLGKPWMNANLIGTLRHVIERGDIVQGSKTPCAA